MSIDDLLSHLNRVHRTRAGWTARCPAHEDRTPSLSIGEREGKILLHCHAGCSAQAVVNALGISITDLFMKPTKEEHSTPKKGTDAEHPSGTPWRYVADYSYAGGRLRKRRWERTVDGTCHKRFAWQHLDESGIWQEGAGGIDPGLYRWDGVSGAEEMHLVEGEKCADAVIDRLGIPATCGPHGSNTFKPEHAARLKGKRVSILADNDQPGLKYA